MAVEGRRAEGGRMAGIVMGWDHIQSDWDGQKRRVRERWSRLAEHELDEMSGRRDRLVAKIQDVYGLERGEAESQVREFESGSSGGPGAGRADTSQGRDE